MLRVLLLTAAVASPVSSAWEIPFCTAGRRQPLVGSALAVPLPKSTKTETHRDVDYSCTVVELHQKGLSFRACEGPHWTSGSPPRYLMAGARDVVTTQIRWPDMPSDWVWDYGPVDVRGTSPRGTKWRYIGMIGQSIEHENVAANGQQVLDEVLNGLCWRQQGHK